MSIIVIPLTGLLLVAPTLAATITLTEQRHTRREDHRREMAEIERWLKAIRATR